MIPILLRVTVSRNSFKKSEFNLGIFSEVLAWISVFWLTLTSIFFFFPTVFEDDGLQNAEDFNYTCVVVGAVLILSMFYWFLPKPLGARHFFVGPKREEKTDDKGERHESLK